MRSEFFERGGGERAETRVVWDVVGAQAPRVIEGGIKPFDIHGVFLWNVAFSSWSE